MAYSTEATYEPKMNPSIGVKQTPFSEASDAFMKAGKLRRRIEALAERLIGVSPEEANVANDRPGSDGALYILSEGARDASSDIDRAHAALDRIERMI